MSGVPPCSIHALLVYGCLQHSWFLAEEHPAAWWVTAGVPDHLCSGLHCISCWRVPGITSSAWQRGSLTNVLCAVTARRFMYEFRFGWRTRSSAVGSNQWPCSRFNTGHIKGKWFESESNKCTQMNPLSMHAFNISLVLDSLIKSKSRVIY